MVGGLADPSGARGVQTPFEVIAFDDDGAGDLAVGVALELRTGVDEQRAVGGGFRGVGGIEAAQSGTGSGEQSSIVIGWISSL